MISMQALILDAAEFLEERRIRGADRRDEVWDGVLHVVPQPESSHQSFGFRLARTLDDLMRPRGLILQPETMLYRPGQIERNYRVPDIAVVDPRYLTRRGIESRAELVVEILSPHDESREKLPHYATCEVQEVWLVDRAKRSVEVYILRGETYERHTTADGPVRSPVLEVELTTVAGPKFRVGDVEL
jgi:Uma2 family endonuclease